MLKRSDGKALLELSVLLASFSLVAAIIVVKVNDNLEQPFRASALAMGGGSSTTMAGEENSGRDELDQLIPPCVGANCSVVADR